LEHKAPLYKYLTETVKGLITIRAFGWQEDFERQLYNLLDASQKPVYFLYCIQRWLQCVLGLAVAAFAIILMTFITQFRTATSGPALWVALINVLGFSQSLMQLIVFYTDLETSLGAVARIKEYVEDIKSEDLALEVNEPPHDRPSQGRRSASVEELEGK
jgi:ATP-binding cassette subfamily C (CFTR/MRP) protein 1